VKKDLKNIREAFPVLSREIYKKPFIYLDNAATSQKPLRVINRLKDYYSNENSNIHRGVHFLSQEATSAYEEVRRQVAHFINAASSKEIIFTKGTTESVNLVAATFGSEFLDRNDEILITQMEHHSNIVPWQMLCNRTGAILKVCPMLPSGELSEESFRQLLTEKTRLVAVTHISNALGTVNPVKKMIAAAHQTKAVVLVDGAQAVPHLSVNVQELDCDFYCFSAHKMYGPMGTGVLYGKESLLEKMPPYQGGGEMISTVTFDATTFNELPFKFEAGTPNVSGVLGLGEAIKFMNETGIDFIGRHEHTLLDYAIKKLSRIEGIIFHGQAADRAGVISFNLKGIHSYDAGVLLDKLGIALRTGHLCAQPVIDFYHVPGFIRASFAVYNTQEEIDHLAEAIEKTRNMLI